MSARGRAGRGAVLGRLVVGCLVVGVSSLPTPSAAGAQDDLGPAQSTPAGHLDREVIRAVIVARIPAIQACYEGGLLAVPDLAGRVIVSFTIAPDGHVAGATVRESTLLPRAEPVYAVEGCIVATVLAYVFPAPEGGGPVQVNYPFVLAPAAEGEGEER